MADDDSAGTMTCQGRMFRAMDVAAEYGVEIPVSLIAVSDTGGPGASLQDFMLDVERKIDRLCESWADAAIYYLDQNREACGQGRMNDVERALARDFFVGHMLLSCVETEAATSGPLSGFSSNPDADADMKSALYGGLYEEE